MIIKLTFVMFLLKQSTLSAVIFPFVPLVLSLLCVYYIRILLSRNVCLVPNEVVSNESDDVLDNVAPCMEPKCGESALCIQQNDVAKEIKYAKEFRSRSAMFVNRFNIKVMDAKEESLGTATLSWVCIAILFIVESHLTKQ